MDRFKRVSYSLIIQGQRNNKFIKSALTRMLKGRNKICIWQKVDHYIPVLYMQEIVVEISFYKVNKCGISYRGNEFDENIQIYFISNFIIITCVFLNLFL